MNINLDKMEEDLTLDDKNNLKKDTSKKIHNDFKKINGNSF